MQKSLSNLLLFTIITFCFVSAVVAQKFDYPPARKADQKDEYFGTTVADPYRWMETDSSELQDWIAAENKLTQSYLATVPYRESLKNRLTELVNYPKYGTPWARLGRLFYFKNDGLQNQSVLYVIDTPEAKPRVLLDPNTLSEDGTVALQTTSVSKDGKYLGYAIARSGSDWNEIFVLDIATGKTLDDHLNWVKFSGIAWHGDGFYYSRYDVPEGDKLITKNEYHKIYFHRIGTNQTADRLIREDKEQPLRNLRASTDREQQYLFISESESTYGNSLYLKRIGDSVMNAPLRPLRAFRLRMMPRTTPQTAVLTPIITDFRSEQSVVTVLDGSIYILTDRDAPSKRLVQVNPTNPTPEHWVDVIPESDSLLSGVSCIGGRFVATYLKDAAHEVFVYDKDGKKICNIELPTLGTSGFSGEKDSDEYFQSFTSFTYPTVIYQCNIKTGERKEFFPSEMKFNKDDYTTERVWYENTAGRKVPIFLTYKNGLKKDGNNPTLLYGYGGFNISVQPSFSAFRIPFLENGGIYAHVVLRGGGEYGETWHKSGTKLQKQNVFDDFIHAAEFLIKEKYTSSEKLACMGGSNGGLLVGAVITQRPELFRVAFPAVGVLDMLRYHKFTIGWAWATDYGTSEESKEMFEYLFGYSPLHNAKPGVNYPAVMITTSDHDDRVVPAHSFKFTAAMQESQRGHNNPHPIFTRIETKAGHGAGKPLSKTIEEQTDIWSFMMEQLGMSFSEAQTAELRVLCYNIHIGIGMDKKLDLERSARLIQEQKPDLVALQEVDRNADRTDKQDQPALLEKMTGLKTVYGKTINNSNGEYGLAILSRFPIKESKMTLFPEQENEQQRYERRGVLVAEVELENKQTIRFANTHLCHLSDERRTKQTKSINELLGQNDEISILCGDINAQPQSKPVQTLLEQWTDATDETPTFSSTDPKVKIDYIFYKPQNRLRVKEMKVLEDNITSDHRPVLVVFEILP